MSVSEYIRKANMYTMEFMSLQQFG